MIFVISSILLISISARAQVKRLSIQFTAGYSVPIGKFQGNNPNDIAQLTQDARGAYYVFNGFRKAENGYALPGWLFGGRIGYFLNKNIQINASYGYTRHEVNTKPASDRLNDIFFNPNVAYRFEQSGYDTKYMLLGAQYAVRFHQILFCLGIQSGVSTLRFPEYSRVATSLNQTPPAEFVSIDQTNKPNSLAIPFSGMIRGEYKFSKSIFAGLQIEYLRADFRYTTVLKSPGIDATTHADLVPYRVVNLSGFIGVSLAK